MRRGVNSCCLLWASLFTVYLNMIMKASVFYLVYNRSMKNTVLYITSSTPIIDVFNSLIPEIIVGLESIATISKLPKEQQRLLTRAFYLQRVSISK